MPRSSPTSPSCPSPASSTARAARTRARPRPMSGASAPSSTPRPRRCRTRWPSWLLPPRPTTSTSSRPPSAAPPAAASPATTTSATTDASGLAVAAVGPKARPLAQALVVAMEGRQSRSCPQGCRQPAVHRQAQHHIGQGEARPGHVIAAAGFQLTRQDLKMPVPACHAGSQQGRVLMGRALPYQAHEGIAPGIVQLTGLPVHPLLDPGACLRLGGQQVQPPLPTRQIAADAVGLPEHEVPVDQHRHHGIGVQRQEGRRVEAALLVFVVQAQLGTGPEHLADIDPHVL
eukprot:Opistho-1_new@62180